MVYTPLFLPILVTVVDVSGNSATLGTSNFYLRLNNIPFPKNWVMVLVMVLTSKWDAHPLTVPVRRSRQRLARKLLSFSVVVC